MELDDIEDDVYCLRKCPIVLLKDANFKLTYFHHAQDIIKSLTPTKPVWKTESSAGPFANVEGIVTVKFCWRGPVEGHSGYWGSKDPLKRMVPNAWPGGRQTEFVLVQENSPITTPSAVKGVHGKVTYKISITAVWETSQEKTYSLYNLYYKVGTWRYRGAIGRIADEDTLCQACSSQSSE